MPQNYYSDFLFKNPSIFKTKILFLQQVFSFILNPLMESLDFRYIYLMRKEGSTKHKIGISKDPLVRLEAVDKGVKGDVELIITRRVFYARWVEKYMHRFFAGKRFYYKEAGRQSGRTEWFEMSPPMRWVAKWIIEIYGLLPIILVAGTFLLLWFYFPDIDLEFN